MPIARNVSRRRASARKVVIGCIATNPTWVVGVAEAAAGPWWFRRRWRIHRPDVVGAKVTGAVTAGSTTTTRRVTLRTMIR